jgi:hypothetical protein
VVFAVWEPILATDWRKPGTSVLGRMGDGRVRQFWDPNHLVSAEILKAEANGKLHQDCCERKGFLWDLAVAYAPGIEWRAMLPEPILLNGPVEKRRPELESVVRTVRSP